MPRREYRSTFRCAEIGCRETQFYVHDTRADQNAAYKRQHEHPRTRTFGPVAGEPAERAPARGITSTRAVRLRR